MLFDTSNPHYLNQAILESSKHLVVATDPEGVVLHFNHAAEVSLGYTSEEVVNKHTPALWHDLDEVVERAKVLSEELGEPIEPGFDVFVVKALREEKDAGEWTFRRKDGTTFPVSLTVTCLKNRSGKVAGYLGIIEDITERKNAEAEREIMIDRLARSNKDLDDFAYAASHDLKAPLRVIENASRWIEEDLSEHMTGDVMENMLLLRSRTQRMEQLLEDLLEYSRVGRNVDHRYSNVVTGQDLMQDVLLLVEKSETFNIHVSPNFNKIKINCMPVQQILVNLINNAIKHHDKDKGEIKVDCDAQLDKVVFTIQDDGPGIAGEYHEQVFKMFQTLQSRDRVEGTGMGLAMVKKHIECVGGHITLESAEGSGCLFRFDIPNNAVNLNLVDKGYRNVFVKK